ncbi:glycosyltransferase family 2 protein [Flavilitoribacter nigricans]|uniref:Glycosyl transferase family 2 n=1 Tax=Flavilitoribacter nigricans (strain ATCC 23147 / DSM 23189 / NBRC 102662 / NCIMB 1420 / SS-2) TaxID=1122177 RepID=A0A2D0NC52_FLAN2|nr:glycosyltransferase family 2 protein [Flavilitoribacter nigricans]PHN05343.1 glycosyl transferase family 2 [Flavilitoribacter nigricans DSM 23189 = NBRC 102662]
MKLSVIIVNYNVRHFLEQALLSVRNASHGLEVEVWVVDNNSVDDSVAMVQAKFPEVRLIVNQDNPGFAVANNQAIRRSTGTYVLLLNPDTVVEEDTFSKCITFMDAHPDAGGLGVHMIDGAGKFLPESKRGFPTPWVAFCKTFGLSRLFPRSAFFNRYHLGYLDEMETHPVDVLSGAFLFMRRSVLDKIGLLDEAFFMYGEDIDLSYRIVQAGYRNYYFPETTIIHYKGESTKKGSLNYVRTFYKAMIIFARKHFRGRGASGFIFMLQAAIYFRAALSLLSSFFKRIYLPLFDAVLIFTGLLFLKDFWAAYHFQDPGYYDRSVVYFNFPLYTLTWLAGIFFSGGYDRTARLRQIIRGVLFGTVILAAIYGFLEMSYRSSRALILLGTAWALVATVGLRLLLHFLRFGNFRMDRQSAPRLVIVGSAAESKRVQDVLQQIGVQKNFIGTVAPAEEANEDAFFLSNQYQLNEVAEVYKVDEIIFCSKDIPAERIMYWMSRLGPRIAYKTIPEESLSIIGSNSRNSVGELYTVDIYFAIDQPANRRNKRLLDIGLSGLLLVFSPLLWLISYRSAGKLFPQIWSVLRGHSTWVGYAGEDQDAPLPQLKPGIFSPKDGLPAFPLNQQTIRRLNFLYAKDYHLGTDLEIIRKALFRTKRD